MIFTPSELVSDLKKTYHYPLNRIQTMVRQKLLYPVKRGLYVTNPDIPGTVLANRIYHPSYLSFEFALSWWNLIPERVVVYTSASYGKNKTKSFSNRFGSFTYSSVPKAVFPYGILIEESEFGGFPIASPEKALCDTLYKRPPVKNLDELEGLLFSNLRIDEELFEQLSAENVKEISDHYHSTNVSMLYRYMRKCKEEENYEGSN